MIKLLKEIKWICFVCCIFLIQQGFSQLNKSDSLKRNIKFSEKEGKIKIFLQLSELNLKTNYDSALYWADMALAESRILKNKQCIFKSYLQRALVFKEKSLYDSVLNTIHFALNYAAEDKKALGDAYEALGAAHGTLGNYDSSAAYFNYALVCYQETKDSSAISKVYGSLGLVHIKKGEFENAIKKTFKALEIAEKIGDKKQIGWTANSLGGIYWYLLEDSLALLYYKKSLEIYTQLKDDFGIASANSNIGGVFQEVKDYTNAVFHYQKALDVFVKLNNKLGISAIYMNFGDLYKGRLGSCNFKLSKIVGNK